VFLVGGVFVGGLVAPVLSPAAAAELSGMQATQRVAASGTPVHLSGSGCASAVHLTVTGFLFPNPPAVLVDTTVAPDPAGDWALDVPMPAMPAFVIAGCDGGDAAPVVIAPTDVDVGSMAPAAVTPTTVEVATSPLVDGSELAVFASDGSMLGSSTAVGGSASVSLPRSIGPGIVFVVALRAPDPGIALPYVPVARRLQMPLADSPTLDVTPRVTATGDAVSVVGTCAGTARVEVIGRPMGWYDTPPVYADFSALAPGTPFGLTVGMPPLPSTVQLTCSVGDATEGRAISIAPADGDLVPVEATATDEGYVIQLPKALLQGLAAFTTLGASVPLALLDSADPLSVQVAPPAGATGVVVIGVESLRENANARQVLRVQAWTFALPLPPATTTTTTAMSESTVAPTVPPAVDPTPPAASTTPPSPALLPATGRAAGPGVALAAVLAVAGAALLLIARRRPWRG
jgi:hypothetical protein